MEKTNVRTSDRAVSFYLEDCVLWTVNKLYKEEGRPALKTINISDKGYPTSKDISLEIPLMLQTQNESQEHRVNIILSQLEKEGLVQRFCEEVWRSTEKGTAYIESNPEFFEKFENLYDRYSRVSDEDQYWNEPHETS